MKNPSDQQLGIIAQRMPSLSWRASDLNDKGYSLTEIDPPKGQLSAVPETCIDVTRSTFDPKLVNANGTIGGMVSYTSTQTAANGFEALRPLDKDAAGASDGQINASDVAYSQLQVWQDLNQDGISQAEELQTLAQRGITSISLAQTTQGVATPGRGTFNVAQVDALGNLTETSREVKVCKLKTRNYYKNSSILRPFDGDIRQIFYINKSCKVFRHSLLKPNAARRSTETFLKPYFQGKKT